MISDYFTKHCEADWVAERLAVTEGPDGPESTPMSRGYPVEPTVAILLPLEGTIRIITLAATAADVRRLVDWLSRGRPECAHRVGATHEPEHAAGRAPEQERRVSERLTIELPNALIEGLVEQVVERVLAELRDGEGQGQWLTGA